MTGHNDFQHLLCLKAFESILREKEHAHTVAPRVSQAFYPDFRGRFDHQLVRDLHHQADTVTGLAAGVFAGPVLQFLNNLQSVVNRAMALLAPNADDRADSAGVMLKGFPVQRESCLFSFHICLPELRKGPPVLNRRSLDRSTNKKLIRF